MLKPAENNFYSITPVIKSLQLTTRHTHKIYKNTTNNKIKYK